MVNYNYYTNTRDKTLKGVFLINPQELEALRLNNYSKVNQFLGTYKNLGNSTGCLK